MCGIVSYRGKHSAAPILLDGLKRLEYRGYDSAGIAVLDDKNGLQVVKKVGRVENLSKEILKHNLVGTTGIGHTRWATHGGITDANAHPHVSCDKKIAIVHNGVIENYDNIKSFLKKKGYVFASETDTEVIANLIAYHYEKESQNGSGKSRFVESVRKSLFHLEGTYGLVVLCTDCPDEIVGVRKSSPLVLGVGDGEFILASDVSACAIRMNNVVYLKDNEIVHIKGDSFCIKDTGERDIEAVIHKLDWDLSVAELGSFSHFMEKEIFEQPEAIANSMRGRFSNDISTSHLGGLALTAHQWRQVDRIVFSACGTAWHACLVGKYLIEKYTRIPVEVEYASEFRYRNSPLEKNTLFFVVSQSGETIDTLEALRESQRKGHKSLAISNVVGSSIARESDGGVYQRSGPEIGVASTKAFTGQLTIIAMLALYLARLRDLSFDEGVQFVKTLKGLPDKVAKILAQSAEIKGIAEKYVGYNDFLFLGRQILFPIALEGALKLKEISYIHAEGYPAAEMKHGPIALISERCPSVFLATQSGVMFNKVLSNIQEVRARKGPVVVVTTESLKADLPQGLVNNTIVIPDCNHDVENAILTTIPLQLFAYYVAVARGCDVDKPRNLAKSVTVE